MAANVKEELQKRASGQEEAVRLTKICQLCRW